MPPQKQNSARHDYPTSTADADYLGRVPWNIGREDAVHRFGALDNHGPYLLAVDSLRDGCTCVTDQAGDLLNRHAIVGEQRDEAVAQLPRCPVLGCKPGHGRDLAETAPDVVRI